MLILHSERLYIRDYTENDSQFHHSWISNSNVMEYMDWKTSSIKESKKELSRAIKESKSKNRKDFFLAIGLIKEDILIGNVGFSLLGNNNQEAEIGWMLLPQFHNLGYATEAAKLLVEYALNTLQLNNIIATCAKENYQSEKIMIKLGMSKIKEFDKFYIQKNKNLLKVLYSLEKN
ncbi:MAG: GNAT family N-acetyltransferase [Halobacteriovoraceae bacterium]|jgi:[ribosomal protein S5]-alanine N-acetyltransferase|nr:GNAT family N-acetyltransferase [Halobacteriovoraceae bacterium]